MCMVGEDCMLCLQQARVWGAEGCGLRAEGRRLREKKTEEDWGGLVPEAAPAFSSSCMPWDGHCISYQA